jgi:multiple sugar transport system substrate-binding protein
MQASYIMVANKEALPYLPSRADINALSYDQLAAWASTVQQKTGRRLLGFPAGPQGLMHRFLEGPPLPVLHRRCRGSVPLGGGRIDVGAVRSLWKSVNPNSTSYDFVQEPLLSGDLGSASTTLPA